MLLVVDVGNTQTHVGLSSGGDVVDEWRIATVRHRTSDEIAGMLQGLFSLQGRRLTEVVGEVGVASVVPRLTQQWEEMCVKHLGIQAFVVGPGARTGMRIKTRNPSEVGADRIVNAVAAYEQVHGAVVVVDFGTATTFDVVSRQGEYLGGVIAPGVMISCEALFLKASKLPRVEIFAKPKSIIAKDTISSMNAGIIYGYVGLVDGIVSRIKEALGVPTRVIATGGLACLIASETKSIDTVDDYLTLKGLKIIYERNRPRREERGKGGVA